MNNATLELAVKGQNAIETFEVSSDEGSAVGYLVIIALIAVAAAAAGGAIAGGMAQAAQAITGALN